MSSLKQKSSNQNIKTQNGDQNFDQDSQQDQSFSNKQGISNRDLDRQESNQVSQSQFDENQDKQSNNFDQQDQDENDQELDNEQTSNQNIGSQQSLGRSASVMNKSQSNISKNSIQSAQKIDEQQPNDQINVDKLVLKCNIHRQDIVKVCGKKDCKEKMLFCLECIEEFAEHVVKHRPFIPIKQFLQELQDNPHTQRKERIEKLQKENSFYVNKLLKQVNTEKTRIAQQSIPALKTALIGLCDQLQTRIFDEIDQFSNIYQYNSQFLNSYLDQSGLLTEILDQVPSFANIYQKYEEKKGSQEADFHQYLEKVYRRLLNNSSVEKTKQAFCYFEDIFENFRQQGNNAPTFIGETALFEKIQSTFNQFIENRDQNYSNIISQYPICSSCSKEVDSEQSSEQIQKKIKELENQLKNFQKSGNSVQQQIQPANNKKSQISFASQTTPVSKVGVLLNSKTEDIKSIQAEIDRLQKSKPGSCKGCRRLYCNNCQNESFCKGCMIIFDPNLKTGKFVIKESKGGHPMAMLDDTAKASVVGSVQSTIHGQSLKLQSISTQLKKLNIGLILGDQELFSGKYEWEVIIENFGQCHSIGFGLCKLDDLKNDLNQNKDFKEISDKTSLILLTSNGTVSGGLKGRVQSFQKEKNAMAFNCLLDFGKNKFFIQGKNIYLERELENNQGYIPCFYSGCCFKSYNNFVLKQKYSYDPIHIQK